MSDLLRDIIRRNRQGEPIAIPSVCSAHPDVLRASLKRAQTLDRTVVIEATSNQVNQDGGYTGMTPADFITFVHALADETKTDRARIIFGGDHLGPQVWRSLPADQAMAKARLLVRDYVQAGFTKIHLDCSEGCAGEAAQLDDSITVPRAADLGRICRDAADANLLYVVGTEVPPPGGARHDDHTDIPATTPQAARRTLDAHMAAFTDIGDIGGLVVQPGVEFTPMTVHHLPLTRDPGLRAAISHHNGVCLEAHSTDYQHPAAYLRLAELGFAFQKVGPALTFAYRQALYSLDLLRHLTGGHASLQSATEQIMRASPVHWQGHYHGDDNSLHLQRHFGLADRIRYYWPLPKAQQAVKDLLDAIGNRTLPDPLLLQVFSPATLDRAATLGGPQAQALIAAQIQLALDPYFFDPRMTEPVR